MNGEEYNELRVSVGWRPITEGQAERGLEHTTFLAAVRDKDKIVAMGRMLFDYGYTAYLGVSSGFSGLPKEGPEASV